MEHSRLLKFFVTTVQSPKMSEGSQKIKFDYQNPANVEAVVPTSQNLREVNANSNDIDGQNIDGAVSNVSSDIVENGDFSFEPVITITKKESTFTKGDLKLQKVTIEEIQNDVSYRIVKRFYTETSNEMVHGGEITETTMRLSSSDGREEVKEATTMEERKHKTKIPKLKFRQTVEKVKAEQRKDKETEDTESTKTKINRRSKISPPSSKPIVTKRNSALMDDEFEKIYEDLIDEQFDFDEHILGNKIDDPDKLEMKFEEIIHDYDENKGNSINVEEVRQSKIPFRRRGSEQDDAIKAKSEKDCHGRTKKGSSIPLLRSKSEHDNEISKAPMKAKEEDIRKEKTKYSSSIPLPRRKSGQDNDLTKTTYVKAENGGVITETVTTITKSAPGLQVIVKKGDISTKTCDSKITNQQSSEQSQNSEDKSESQNTVEINKIRKSIPRFIDSKNEGRKVIRTYTRTVTSEKIVSGKDNKLNKVDILEKTTELTNDGPKSNNEITTEQKENNNIIAVHSLPEENIVKDSIRIGIPSFDSKSESNEENFDTVEVTKILEWKTNVDDNIDKKVKKLKLQARHEVNKNEIIKSDDIMDEKSNKIESIDIAKAAEYSKPVQSVIQDSNRIEENKSFESAEIVEETSKISITTTSTVENQTSPEKAILSEIKDIKVNVKEKEGSRFNKVSNLNILKGIDNDNEILKSPRLLSSNKTEVQNDFKSSTAVDENPESPKKTKVFEVLESPKLDKDGNIDLLPEYNIRIKRFSREMKHGDNSLNQLEEAEKETMEDKNSAIYDNRLIGTKLTGKIEISNMDNARNLLSRVLDREKKLETIKTKEEVKEIYNNVILNRENDLKTPTTDEENTVITSNIKDVSFNEKNMKLQEKEENIENVTHEHLQNTKIEKETDIKKPVKVKDENVEKIEIKGKVGRLINKIDGKHLNNDTTKKEDAPVRRSVLSRVAMFERQEPLDSVKARKSHQELKLPKLNTTLREEQGSNRVHVHTPKIVEEVLKSADWDSNKNEDKIEKAWKIDFDKIILNRKDINIDSFNEKSTKDSMYQVQRVESIVTDNDTINNLTSEAAKKDFKFIPDETKVEVVSDITGIRDTPAKTDFKIQISDDYSAVNLVQDDLIDVGTVELRNKLKVEPSVRDMATSPTRLSFDAKDFESKVKNQILSDAPVIIVHPKINDNMSKSTEAIFSTQPKIEPKGTNKKVDRTTSMTEKLYPEKVKANIALYESIKNDSYLKANKTESKIFERPTSLVIFETYKNERFAKANKVDNRTPYTPQNSVNNDYISINEASTKKDTYKYESSISVDETKINTKGDNVAYRQKYGSLQFINESIDTESLNNDSIKSETVTEMNKGVYRLTFDDNKSISELDIITTDNLQSTQIINEKKSTESSTKQDIKPKIISNQLEKIGVKPINEIVLESYEIYSKNGNNTDKVITDRKFRRFKSKYDDEDYETGENMIKSLPNMDIGDVKNRVRKLSKMKSVEKLEERKELINIKEMPRKLSVLEKIALFEGKANQTKIEQTTVRIKTSSTQRPPTHHYTEKEYLERIEELKGAKEKYGTISNMPKLTLRNDLEMPVLAVGTAMLDPRLLKHIIGAAIDLGYRAIDTGYIYGNEREVGEAIKAKIDDGTVTREDLFIIGKLWSTFHRSDLVEIACRASLDAMGLKYFDLYLIHNPMSFKEGPDPFPKIATVLQYSQYDYLDAWYGMESLVNKGLAKSIGVSNFNSVQIQRIMDKGKIKPSVNQVECHPYLSQQRLDQYCSERNIKLSCFGTLGSKGTPDEYKSSLTPVIDDALVKVMASGLNVTAAQLLIRYQIECERSVVVKSSSAAHLWDNLKALNFTLTSGQVDALHALNRNKRTFTFKGMGDTHKNYPFKIAF